MRALWQLAKVGFRQRSRYRTATVAALLTNTVFGLIRASLLLSAIGTAGRAIGGYDARQAATYVWLGQALLAPLGLFGAWDVAERVKSGDVAVDFLRPRGLFLQYWARDVGRAGYDIVPRALPPLAVGALTTGIVLPSRASSYVLGVASVLVAMTLTFSGFFAVNLLALWVVDVRGYSSLYMVLLQLLAGFLVPVSWFPGWLQRLAHSTPFPSMVQTPIDMFTGVLQGWPAVRAVGVQLAWMTGMLAACALQARWGARRVVVQGG